MHWQSMAQGMASPVPAPEPMFRVSPVLRRVPSAVPPTVVGGRAHAEVDLASSGPILPFYNFTIL